MKTFQAHLRDGRTMMGAQAGGYFFKLVVGREVIAQFQPTFGGVYKKCVP